MSGHSKWSTIKHKKAANDAVKSGVFTKIAGAITVAAKKGGSGDPDKNFSLRLAMDKARAVNMPKEKIEKAIEKGVGAGEGDELVELVIEGYGPEGVAIIITALTDSRNRTVAEVKNLLEKHGGRMGEPGSVMYQFDRVAIIHAEKSISEEDELKLIELNVLDFENHEERSTVIAEVDNLQTVTESLVSWGYPGVSGEIGYKAKNYIQPQNQGVIEEFLSLISDYEDVQEVYANI